MCFHGGFVPVKEAQQVQKGRKWHNNSIQFATHGGFFLFGPGELLCGSVAAVGFLDCVWM
jgi:hypothetical protein